MKKSFDEAVNDQRKMYIGIVSTMVFGVLMAMVIVYFYEAEPNLKGQILYRFGDQLQDSAISTHWQWQAEGRPQRIMLVHFNREGKEIGRRPVSMTPSGWPEVQPDAEGCRKLWQVLLNAPMEVDGFRIRSEYHDDWHDNPENAHCRFSLSAGDYFDYIIFHGDVTYDED